MKELVQINKLAVVSPKWQAHFNPLKLVLLALALICSVNASGQTSTLTTNFVVGAAIPDASPSGLASAKTIATPIASITGMKVSLKLSGTFNGDLYCYLTHSSGHSVLLNRVGRRSASNLGYSDDGINVTFDDAATNGNIHNYRFTLNGNHNIPITGALTNTWAPDGRTNSPYSVFDTNMPTAMLSSFNGLNPNGEWVLYVADVEAGDLYTLDNWGLEITGYTSPSITANPVSLTRECSTENATFSVSADGSAPLGYQWRHSGSTISGETNSTLTITNATFVDGGNYDVIVSGPYGAITSSVAVLTIQDTTPPSITAPADIAANTDAGVCGAAVTYTAPVGTDLCGGAITARIAGLASGSIFPVGKTTNTFRVTDGIGLTAKCSFVVTVSDSENPVVNAPANIAVNNDAGQCSASVSFAAAPTDNCGVAGTVCVCGAGLASGVPPCGLAR